MPAHITNLPEPTTMFVLAIYSLPFFVLWLIIAILTKKDSKFTISKTLWLIAGFGISHGIHEWTEFFEFEFHVQLDPVDSLVLAISFYLLIQFGISTLVISARRNKLLHLISLAPVMLWLFLVREPPHEFMASQIGDLYARYSLGLLGCFLTSAVLFIQRTEIRKTGQPGIIRSLYLTSGGFLFYGLLSGLVVPDVPLFPGYPLSYSAFYRTTGVPVQAFRTVAMIFIGYQMVRLLRVFEWEKISSLLGAKEELERKVEERTAELAETNRALELLIETEPECVKLLTADGSLLRMNRAGLSMIDAESEAQVLDKKMYDLVDEKHRQAFKDLTERIFRGGSGTLEFETTGLKGRRIWLETHAAPLRNERNEIIALLGITRDITARKKAESALSESEKHYRLLFETMLQGIIYHDADGKIVSMNKSAERILGRPAEQLVGKVSAGVEGDAIREDGTTIPAAEGPSAITLRTGRSVHDVIIGVLNTREKAYRWLRVDAVPLFRGGETRPYLSYTTFIDITGRKKAEDSLQRSEKRYRHLFENMQEGMLIQELVEDEADKPIDVRYIDVNPAAERFLGKTRAEIIGKTRNQVLGVHDPEVIEANSRVLKTGQPFHMVRYSAGARRWYESFSYSIGMGQVATLIMDITERKLAESRVRQSEATYRNLFESSMDGIFIIGLDGNIIDVNSTAYTRLGYTKEELLALHISDLDHPEFARRVPERMQQIGERGFAVFESAHLRKDGTVMPVEINSRLIEYEGKPVYLSVIRDITDRKKAEQEIRHMAQHDALTGLPNRALFGDIFKIEAAQVRRSRKKLGVLFLDLDRFKEINDTLGHNAGDQLLKAVSDRITKNVRESDTVARIGGDEFNVILADLSKVEDVTEVTRKIIASFQNPFTVADQEVHITTSIGISIFPDDSTNIDMLLRHADIAMYYAKERGRNNFQFYNPEINARSLERIRLEGLLRQTVHRGELVVYYQPLVNIRTREIVCAEALVRWRHPEGGIMEPARFIPAAEESGFITAIDEYVLRTACFNVRSWLDAGRHPVCVTVNLSAREFQNPDLTKNVARILHDTGAPPDYLIVEITESLAMSNIERTIKRLNELADMGVNVAIDDFGTGYSSLSHLKRLPVKKLKIDKSFIRDITTNADDRTIIKAVTQMAHTMKLKVAAEGVETEGQFEFLKRLQCDEAQGFLFSSPLPPEQFAELIAHGK